METLWQFLKSKEWSIFPFIAPTFSLFISLYLVPMYSGLYSRGLQTHLDAEGLGDKLDFVNSIAKDRSLQIAYLTGIPAFIASLIASLKSNHPTLLTAILLILLPFGLAIFLKVFLASPGFHSSTRFPEKRKPTFIFKRNWTYLDFYSKALAVLNVVLIIITIIALPDATPSNNSPNPVP